MYIMSKVYYVMYKHWSCDHTYPTLSLNNVQIGNLFHVKLKSQLILIILYIFKVVDF